MTDFDLSSVTYQPSLSLKIRLPNGQPSGWVVELMGPGHEKMDHLNAELRRFQASQRLEQQQAERKNRPYIEDDAETAAFFEGWFAKRILGWSAVRFSGEDFPANDQNKARIFSSPAFGFVRDQIHDAWRQADDFLPKPKPDSGSSPNPASGSIAASPTAAPSGTI